MQNLIDAKLLLQVFSLVEKQGERVMTPFGAGFQLDALQVASGFDGYELYFTGLGVTVTLGFHQKYFIDAANEEQVDAFILLLKRIASQNE